MNNLLLINKTSIYIFMLCACFFLYYLTSNFIFGILALLTCLGEIRKNFPILLLFILISCYFLIIDVLNSKNFSMLSISIILIASRFSNNILKVLLYYSYFLLIIIGYLFLFYDQMKGELSDVLLFQQRLWLYDGYEKDVNPNPLGLMCAMCALGFILNKRFIYSIFPLFIMLLTQSRSAILFFFFVYLISQKIKLKNLFYILMTTLPILYLIINSSIMNRFTEDGEGGRMARFLVYKDLFIDNIVFGIPATYYNYMEATYGSIDNLYILSVLRYGIFGIFLLIFFLFLFINNTKDEHYRLRLAIFLGFYLLGLIEGSFVANYMTWIFFAMSFNNVRIGSRIL